MFPTLTIRADGYEANGAFAEMQASFLEADAVAVTELDRTLESKRIGVVAHFYMDPELQGVLAAATFPHIHISDSLAMADRAVAMAKAGMEHIVVLGVDFMSENVRALLDAEGFEHVQVYRASDKRIGCSLAESAEAPAYLAYLERASRSSRPLHVVYINTSLRTKGKAHALVPTITCTSSNVVQTILQAAAQVEEVSVWFGPDTYMGRNLAAMLETYATLDDAQIRAIHPAHDRESLRSLRERFHIFDQGICVVHHMFGDSVVREVEQNHKDAFVTAHFEVPGEMFDLAVRAQQRGRGVVGSTSNILSFIDARVAEMGKSPDHPISFVLGTEAGMVTSIARQVRKRLHGHPGKVEIVFPVASDAMVATDDNLLRVVPGAAGGEGCTTAGGCATCPYMKMNSLDALFDLISAIDTKKDLRGHSPEKYVGSLDGRKIADLGRAPILEMRHFQRVQRFSPALVERIKAHGGGT
ncbi:MAG: quinolinate synthase NadA [Myxococcales bacterium]|nr:quinolinate synthase NadA [Myxococcales bacterium]